MYKRQASALSTALSRSAVHSLDAITMTMVLPLKAITAFPTLSDVYKRQAVAPVRAALAVLAATAWIWATFSAISLAAA